LIEDKAVELTPSRANPGFGNTNIYQFRDQKRAPLKPAGPVIFIS